MKTISVNEINERLRTDAEAFIRETDAAFAQQIEAVAEELHAHVDESPIVLLSGPSGSGKTTSARMLEHYLDTRGHETHALSMDNYFNPLSEEQQQLSLEGKLDLESPNRMDISFLNEQLMDMFRGKEVPLPTYDFATCGRVFHGETLRRRPGEIVILEGIHALNPAVISIPDEYFRGIYVSVRTRVTLGDETLHPAYIRLMRRMLRDLGRDRSFAETVRMFENVQRGENQNIMPYKNRADYDIDTFQAYELAAYHGLCAEDLSELSRMPQLELMERMLEQLIPVREEQIPGDALVREFIGNSLFIN